MPIGRRLRDGTNTTVDLTTPGFVEVDARPSMVVAQPDPPADTHVLWLDTDDQDIVYATQDELDALVISGGGMSVASTAEALAGTNNTKAMTPLRVREIEPFEHVDRYYDGGTDDDVAINAALAAAVSTGKRKVVLPGRVFNVDNIVVPTYIALEGDSQSASQIVARSGATGSLVQLASWCALRDVYIDGNGETVNGLYLYQAARSMLHNVYVTDCVDGIVAAGTAPGAASHAIKYTDVSVYGCTGVGLELGNYAYDSQLENIWIGVCGTGARFATGAQRATNLHIWGSTGNGLELDPGTHSNIVNAYLESNGGAGLFYDGGNGGVSIVGSRLWNNAARGAYILGGSHVKFSSTTFEDNVGEGVLFHNHLNGSLVNCHAFSFGTPGVQTYGVRSTGTSDYLTVMGNDMLDSQHVTAGISTVGAHDRVFGNQVNTDRNVPLVHSLAGTASSVSIDGPAGQVRDITVRSDASSRWIIRTTSTAESGSNAGSDLQIIARTDAGGFSSTPIAITRSTGKVNITTELELDGAFNHDGTTVGLYGVTPVVRSTGWTTFTNLTSDKTLDANATTLDEVADVLGTLIEQLKLTGIIGA